MNNMYFCFISISLLTFCSARTYTTFVDENVENDLQHLTRDAKSNSVEKSNYLGDLKHVYKIYEECSSKDLLPCIKLKFIVALDRISRKVDFQIAEGVSLIKDDKTESNDEVNEITEETLPRSLEEKNDKLNSIILDKIINFFSSRSLNFKLSGLREIDNNLQDVQDGRKKGGKYGSMMMLPLMMGGSMIPMALGTLALLAGKALIIAKLALTLSLIIGLKKLISSDEQSSSYQVVSHGTGHYKRSLYDDNTAAQSMAYKSYIPLSEETSTSQHHTP